MELRNFLKYHPAGSVQRCQKQKIPRAGGVAGVTPSSAIVSNRSVAPTAASSIAVSLGTTPSTTRWPTLKPPLLLSLTLPIVATGSQAALCPRT
jgi:hypothetical protein